MARAASGRAGHWTGYAGAWLGIGTAPGALLVGAGLVQRHDGALPLVSLLLGLILIALVLWFQGRLGLRPPWGEGGSLTQVAALYFTPAMGRILAALIALGMTGWFGVNVSMGAAALAALLGLPHWAAAGLLGLPIAGLALRGIRGWNRLALLTTACVLALVVLILWRYRAGSAAATAAAAPLATAGDMAVMLGYVGVFSLRAPDFTAGLAGRRDLAVLTGLLLAPLTAVMLAGAVLGQRSGSADVVAVLAGPGGLAAGNLLVALAVVAPSFTTFYSGAPAWQAATGVAERYALPPMAVAGLALAATRCDLLLLPWLAALGAVLPPAIVPLLAEFLARSRGRAPRRVPAWPWLVGALIASALVLARSPLAMAAGFAGTGAATALWQMGWPAARGVPGPDPAPGAPAGRQDRQT